MRDVILVTGPPCSGKTSLAHFLADDHEVVDYDDIAGGHRQFSEDTEAEVQRRLDRIAADPEARAVVIRGLPIGADREQLADRLGASRVIVVTTPQRECRARAKRERPSGTQKAIGYWFWRFTPSEHDEHVSDWW